MCFLGYFEGVFGAMVVDFHMFSHSRGGGCFYLGEWVRRGFSIMFYLLCCLWEGRRVRFYPEGVSIGSRIVAGYIHLRSGRRTLFDLSEVVI